MVTVAVCLLLSGCKASPASDQADGTELTFWTFNGLHEQFYAEMVKEWNKKYPERKIKLNTVVYPYGQMHDNLSISLLAGKGVPDIADVELGRYSNFLKGSDIPLTDLTPLVEDERDKFVEARLTLYSKNGKLYGLDTHVGTTVMYYNMEMMNKAGVDPDDIKTWEDYRKAGKKVVKALGKPMTTIETTDPNSFLPLVSQQESGYFDQQGRLTLNNETNVKTLEFLKTLIEKDKIAVTTPGGNHHSEEYYGFMNQGGAASVLMPIWYMGRFLDYMPDLKGKIAIRPLPAWEEGGDRSAGMGGTATVIPKQAKEVDLAKDFLKFAKASKEGNIKLWTVLGFDPLRWDVWDSDELKKPNQYTEYFQNGQHIFSVLLDIKDEINPLYLTEDYAKTSDLVNRNVLYEALKTKSKTPKEALDKAAAEVKGQ
ncbi:ABC transporter substrate-binding protein [Bacillus haynesii]|uniref:ABC transporter substrate-binding protein n=1 Tax=Bacillus haynesii TaxID=1925021 RepID=UPI0022810AB0|nr:ABC transporter substrate-binding protein [Bacillus haynesii]MCY7814959.1 ABC transporter substrate-binding protein [Bacillus haynesii]MCY8224333.1 ABC transporter substrate-binding protein [Bacillus haynesii]MCY8241057.1 ABC transporter substrate-binding protein [Bacillus haynesii]MCY8371444.1 ABC transporter substrate-binding protein [Bacillus haynesii]MCY8567487.1 ABC transporter substrate-binding protein [Bacillus haynesii]